MKESTITKVAVGCRLLGGFFFALACLFFFSIKAVRETLNW